MSKKGSHRIRNWPDYNKALVNRGSLTVWFDEESIANWHAVEQNCSKGRPQVYSDIAIECALTLRAIFKQSLRATQGLVASLMTLLNLPLETPNYTTLSRRQRQLKISLPCVSRREPVHLVVDASGLKVYGEGE